MSNSESFAGKVAVVSGASRGIGRATAEALASEGVDLVLAAGAKLTSRQRVLTFPKRMECAPLEYPQMSELLRSELA